MGLIIFWKKKGYHQCRVMSSEQEEQKFLPWLSEKFKEHPSSQMARLSIDTATKFSESFLSQISKLNSYSSRIQRISLGLASFFLSKYLSATWSKKITIFVHSK
jgi:hypothetical protein